MLMRFGGIQRERAFQVQGPLTRNRPFCPLPANDPGLSSKPDKLLMARAKFSIGIDLGTTNCAMAFEPLDTANPPPETFLIPQLENLTGFSADSTLPAFLY